MATDIETDRSYTQSGNYGSIPVEAIAQAQFNGDLSLFWRDLGRFDVHYEWDHFSAYDIAIEAASVGPVYWDGRWTSGTAVKASIAAPPPGQLSTSDIWAGFALSRVADWTTLHYEGGQRVRFGGFPLEPAKDGELATLMAYTGEYPGANGFPITLAGYQGGACCVPLSQNGNDARIYLQNAQGRAPFNLQSNELLFTLFPSFEVGRPYQGYTFKPPATYTPLGIPTNLAPVLATQTGGNLLQITGSSTYALWLVLMRQPPLLKFDRCYALLGMKGPVSVPIGPKNPPGGPKKIGDTGIYSTEDIRYIYGLTWEVDWAADCSTSDDLFEISPADNNFATKLIWNGPGDKGPYRPEIGDAPYVSASMGWQILPP